MNDTFCGRLVSSFEANSAKTAMQVIGDDRLTYTFGEMLDAVLSVAHRLATLNVKKGDRIALIGENHPSWAIAYLGILYNGNVCVPLDPDGEIETITNFIENSEAKLAFISHKFRDKFANVLEKIGESIPAVVWGKDEADAVFDDMQDWISGGFPDEYRRLIPQYDNDHNALLIYTSGTTGKPKGVPLTHGNIVAELDSIADVINFKKDEKILSLLPLFHVYLQIVNLWVASTYAFEVAYLKELSPTELSDALKTFKPTILTTVPRLWYMFHKKIFDGINAKSWPARKLIKTLIALNGKLRDVFKVNLGKKLFSVIHDGFGGDLRIAISAGSRFDNDVAADFHKFGFTILQGYGLTETSGAATATLEDDNRVGSVGKPLKEAEIKIAEPDNKGVGEVLIRGKIVFSGYYNNADATKDAFTADGWFKTGDLGHIDSDGHLFIVGRAKDVIVLPSGKNVHPEDLETHYLKTPYVAELAVIGIDDEAEHSGAERLAAVVVPDFEYLKVAKIANSKEAVRYALDDLGRELPEYQRVRDYIITSEPLPRTATRKIKRFELKKLVDGGKLSFSSPEKKTRELNSDDKALISSPAGIAVVEILRTNSKFDGEMHPNLSLELDLGLDSLGRAEAFAAVESAFGVEFDGDEAAKALTVADLINVVKNHAGDETEINAAASWNSILNDPDLVSEDIKPVLRTNNLIAGLLFAFYKTMGLFFRLFFRLEVSGIENLRSLKAPFIITPNHQSYLDPFVICSLYPFDVFAKSFHVGAGMYFSSRPMRLSANLLNIVPVDQDSQLMKAMKAGAVGLRNGFILNIYPEGERSYDGKLHDFKKGAAILSVELGLPILPVAIDGTQHIWGRRSSKIRLGKVKVAFGKPTSPVLDGDESYSKTIDQVRNSISGMQQTMRQQQLDA